MRKILSLVLLFLLVLTLINCGGSGGTGTRPFGLIVATDWSRNGAAGTPTGQSQVVTILNASGSAISNATLQNTSSTNDFVTFNLTSGVYTVRVRLYSGTNGSGTITGEFQRRISFNGSQTIATRVGAAVQSLAVSPSTTNIVNGSGESFAAEGLDSASIPTFIAPGSVTWSVLGGIGNVQSNGVFTATTVGSGSIRASHTPSGLLGSSAVTISNNNPTRSKWTILVYMNAASDLQPFSVMNMNQLERVAQNNDVRFVVQWKQATIPVLSPNPTFEGTRRYLVKPENTNVIGSELIQDLGTSVDAGRTETLREFLRWGKQNYPADRYGLIMWSHGNGWRKTLNGPPDRAVSYDDSTGSAIQIWDFDAAFGTEQFEFLAWDASLMQMTEVAYEARNNSKYVIGSEESPPGEGYPYDLVFAPFRDNPDETTLNLTRNFVTATLNYPLYANRKITQSVVDTSKLGALAIAISDLGIALQANIGSLGTIIPNVRTNAQSYSPTSTRYYRDLKHLVDLLEPQTTNATILSAITSVRLTHAAAVVWEGSNAQSPNSHGLSIDFTPGSVFAGSATNYARMKFAQDTQWNEFLAVAP